MYLRLRHDALLKSLPSLCEKRLQHESEVEEEAHAQAEAQKEKDEAEVQVNCNLSAAAEILFILDSL
ncbi:hypothetical protein PDJAM_G00075730 [Pangasius djambal]|uniref:Uncharacterized protein n=1 Tax=Pangasius djambal TaxID=1691987 RepID=A0ACC5Z1W2_9TELE|nr:hypothetical protein [Pangasius djambal]